MPDLARDGITINLVLPGSFLTSRISPEAGRSPEGDKALQAQLAPLAAAIIRWAASVIRWSWAALSRSSPPGRASYITGAVYQVDGGSIKSNV